MGEASGNGALRAHRGHKAVRAGIVAGLLWVGTAAQAAPYGGPAYEPFDYGTANDTANDTNDGDLISNTGGTGFGSAAWASGVTSVNINGGSLAYTGVNSAGNRLRFDGALGTQNEFRNVGTVDSGSFYFSFLVSRNNTTNRTFNFALYSGTASTGEKFAVGQYGTATASSDGNFAMSFLNNGTILTSSSPIAVGTGVTHLVVGRLDFDASGTNERVRIYIDPSATGGEPATPYLDGISPLDLGSFDNIRPFAGNTLTTGNAFQAVSADFDEIRLGTSYAAVVPIGVPEPSVLGLFGVGALAVARGRRRRA